MKKLLFIVFLLPYSNFFSQTKADSLKGLLSAAKQDTNQVNVLNDLSWEFLMANNLDTVLYYANTAKTQATSISFQKGLATSYNIMGIAYEHRGNYPEALKNYYSALKIREQLKNKSSIASTYNNIGIVYYRQGNYTEAIRNQEAALKIAQEMGDEENEAFYNGNIGIFYFKQKKYTKALEKYFISLAFKQKTGNNRGMSNVYNNIGNVYFEQGKYEEALKMHFASLKIAEEINDKMNIASSYLNIGAIYSKQKKYALAEKYYQKALADAKKIGVLDLIKSIDESLSEAYENTGKYKEALTYYKDYTAIKDSLLNEENTKKTVQTQMQYEFDKKDALAKETQNRKDALAIAETKRQRTILFFVSGFGLVVLLLALFIFRGLKAQRKANKIISKQKEEVHHQKEIVEEKQKEILDSIHYAKRIQRAVITSDSYISQYVKDYFIYYQPKDIVSGDFYWALQVNNKFYLATADCTGHGVPGAFMSLLNISILNEVVIEKKILRPDLILNEARKDIIKSLNPTGSEESKDGMDCILACFDFENLKLEYAAANNSFYIVRNNELLICKADKMPVGKSPKDNELFTLYTIDLQIGDTIYMLTDGLPDQFGGTKGKKFKYKQLEEALLANNNISMEQQKNRLEKSFIDWKGNLEQVDDVLLIGIKL